MTIRAAVLALFSLALATRSRAQQANPPLQAGTHIRLTLADGSVLTGRAVSSSDSAIVIQLSAGARSVPIPSIRRTEFRHTALGQGVATGATIGVVLGIAGMVAINGALCESNCPLKPQNVLGGAIAGAVPGVVVGGTIGAFLVRWTEEGRPLAVGPTLDGRGVAVQHCAGNPGGHLGLGMMRGGGFAAGASIVLFCRPRDAIAIDGGFSDTPDRTEEDANFSWRFSRLWIARTGIAGEHFLGGGFRGLLSIDGYRYYDWHQDTEFNGNTSYTETGWFGLGAGAGVTHSIRLGETVALRSEMRAHFRTSAVPEWSVLVGLERIR